MLRLLLKIFPLGALVLLCVLSLPQGAPRGQTVAPFWSTQVTVIEAQWRDLYQNYFGRSFPSQGLNGAEIAQRLTALERETGQRAAVIWLSSRSQGLLTLMVLPGQAPLGFANAQVSADQLENLTQAFLAEVAVPTTDQAYQTLGRELYDLLLAPLQPQLRRSRIDTLILCAGPGLRALPFAALYDGRRYLIEDYALALIPGFNLAQIGPGDLRGSQVLALGASEFRDLPPLPGVALELAAIRQTPWPGATLENQAFTLAALRQKRQEERYGIVHLATHARFLPGEAQSSYIQFGDQKVRLTQIASLGLDSPPVELLVLSACQTALGDLDAELGFSGLALQSGARSALASLWNVSDIGAFALMNEFYYRLKQNPHKAEALRQSQIALIRGQVTLQDGTLQTMRQAAIPLPFLSQGAQTERLSHPYYWSGFVLVGSPW